VSSSRPDPLVGDGRAWSVTQGYPCLTIGSSNLGPEVLTKPAVSCLELVLFLASF
jgi:hypothetical protein